MSAVYLEKLVTAATKVSSLNLQSEVFKNIFDSFPQNPDLPEVKKYYQLSSPPGSNEKLMALPGGQSLLTEDINGRGKVYVSAVPLNGEFSNLPLHALFLPVMFRIALLSSHDQPLFYTIGHDESIEIPAIQYGANQLLKLVKDSVTIIPDVRQREGSTILYTSDQIKQNGTYKLIKQDSIIAVLAFNDNRSESDLSYFTEGDLVKMMPESTTVLEGGKGSLKNKVSELNIGAQLWKLCIILALIFLAAEIILVRFYRSVNQLVL